jgi:hypothetical protein
MPFEWDKHMQKKGFIQEVPPQCRGIILSSYIGLEKMLPRNFNEMSLEDFVKNYNKANDVIKDIYSLTIGEFFLCMNNSSGKNGLKKTVEELVQYKSDMIHYFNSLKEIKK